MRKHYLARDKKGVELTMQTIIIAVLVIVVLIVLILIFSKSAKNFFLGTSDCAAKGGECMPRPCPDGYTNHFAGNPSCSDNEICCVEEKNILGLNQD